MAGKPGMHKDREAYRLGTVYQDKLRAKINSAQILERLRKHACGEVEMSSSQVQAAMVLLRKTMPDLASTEIKQDVTSYRDTLARVAESMGWAVAAAQVKAENDTDSTQVVDSKEAALSPVDGDEAGRG